MMLYEINDPRYLEDPFSATVFEVCDTLAEALENKDDYGNGNVIVKVVLGDNKRGEMEIVDLK